LILDERSQGSPHGKFISPPSAPTNALTIELEPLLGPSADPAVAGLILRQVGSANPEMATALLTQLAANADQLRQSDPAIVGALLRGLHLLFLKGDPQAVAELDPLALATIDEALPKDCLNRHLLLHLLVMVRTAPALTTAVERLRAEPPRNWEASGQLLSPLMQHRDWTVEAIFPAILDTLAHPSMASPVLDLANFITREKLVDKHPAADRTAALASLLAGVTSRLERFEADPRSLGDDIPTVQARLAEAVALSVSLCDALGLVGQATTIPRLTETMQLTHRRVQTEAAGALARMGDPTGIEKLISLVSEPVARLRVIAYADELGLSDRIADHYRSQESDAEANMALWLSQPSQMGIPPTEVETLDRRHQYWPGYERPIDCFLVRFHYDLGGRSYSNVGISGPVTFALANNVADLPIDDIYAIYAGWHADHQQIFAIAPEHINDVQRRLVTRLAEHAIRAGYFSPHLELFGCFFEEEAAVFRAFRDDKSCRVITDGLESIHLPLVDRPRQPDAGDLWNLYKGRKILRTFNPLD